MNLEAIKEQVEQGFIRAIPGENGLTLYNYTEHAQFDKHWTPETLACRGLVMRGDKICARPFKKFFNLGERPEPIPVDVPELATKHDGSLVIVFHDGEKWRACTRGSWINPQTAAASRWLATHSERLDPRCTWLFELCAPWNRIVVSYDTERMILIGVFHTESGSDYSYRDVAMAAEARGLEAAEFIRKPVDAVDLRQPFNNSEGYVARFADGFRVKLKFEDYKRIHAVLSSASTDFVVESLAAGRRERMESMPDEFMAWLADEERRVMVEYDATAKAAHELAALAAPGQTQKDKALIVLQGPEHLRPIAFNILARKSWEPVVWKMVANRIDKRLWRPPSMTVGNG